MQYVFTPDVQNTLNIHNPHPCLDLPADLAGRCKAVNPRDMACLSHGILSISHIFSRSCCLSMSIASTAFRWQSFRCRHSRQQFTSTTRSRSFVDRQQSCLMEPPLHPATMNLDTRMTPAVLSLTPLPPSKTSTRDRKNGSLQDQSC